MVMADEEPERGNWTGRLDFLLSCIGFAVGLGNVWRFPYLAYKNGGASFLFPYIIMLLVSGLPLFFMELAIGQFSSQGPITCWKMAPAFMGIGYGMVTISAVIAIYYNMIIAWAVYYMFVSFVSLDEKLPWETCGNDWNTKSCRYEALPKLDGSNTTEQWDQLYGNLVNQTCVNNLMANNITDLNPAYVQQFNDQLTWSSLKPTRVNDFTGFSTCDFKYTSAAEEYYERHVLNQADNTSLNDIGDLSLKLTFTLLLSWLLIFVCLMKGIKTSGRVVYFTATFPYVILVVLLIRGLTLDGHEDGIEFYVVPEWDKLTDVTIWNSAATQIFYSLGVSFGGLLTMASYNKFDNNCYRDALLVSFINCGTSVFAGFAIFSLLGHMAYVTNQKVEDVATSGAGLAFVAYPDGISRLPQSPIWAFLFFFMILTLGLDSQFAMMETVISAISDIFPRVLRKQKTPFTAITCVVGFLLGLPLCSEGGGRVLTVMNDYSGSYNLMIIALFEIICLVYVYGMKNFRADIEMMIGVRTNCFWGYWYAMWYAITPVSIVFIVVMSAEQYEPSSYEGKEIEDWAEGIGWVLVGVPILCVFVVMGIMICKMGFKESMSPLPNWGPVMPENQIGRYAHLRIDAETGVDALNGKGTPGPPSYDMVTKDEEAKQDGGYDNAALESERL